MEAERNVREVEEEIAELKREQQRIEDHCGPSALMGNGKTTIKINICVFEVGALGAENKIVQERCFPLETP